MSIESLNKRIEIQKRKSEPVKVKGVPTYEWDSFYSCWCKILDLIGTEKYDAYNSKLENTIKFKCRLCSELKDIQFNEKEYQIIWNKKVFNIIFVDTLGGSKEWIILQGKFVS